MSARHRHLLCVAIAALLSGGCAGKPVSLGSPVTGPPPLGTARTLVAEACGFQLLLVIPIAVNDRAQRAYRKLEAQAEGDHLTAVEVQERWIWGFVGTTYCTTLTAKAIRADSS